MSLPPDPSTPPDVSPTSSGDADLREAVQQLRTRVHPRAVEVANDVLRQAVRASRHSLPIRAHAPHSFVRISDQVLISRLRQRIDGASRTCAVGRVVLLVDPDAVLREITIELFVQYGEVLVDAADGIRLIVDEVVEDLLGRPETPVALVTTHVHVSDITIGSPHLVDPSDEV